MLWPNKYNLTQGRPRIFGVGVSVMNTYLDR